MNATEIHLTIGQFVSAMIVVIGACFWIYRSLKKLEDEIETERYERRDENSKIHARVLLMEQITVDTKDFMRDVLPKVQEIKERVAIMSDRMGIDRDEVRK